jgi:hypothetical protein
LSIDQPAAIADANRLLNELDALEARQARGLARRLELGQLEQCGHRDDGAGRLVPELLRKITAQRLQHLGRELGRSARYARVRERESMRRAHQAFELGARVLGITCQPSAGA